MATSANRESSEPQSAVLDTVFACLARSESRRILGLVSDRSPEPVATSELATALAAGRAEELRGELTADERERAAVALEHVHLPKLTDAGLLTQDTGGAVALADHPALRDPGIRELIEADAGPISDSLEVLLDALTDARRRTILDVLSHQFGPIHLETLAREVEAYDRDVNESEVSTEAVEQMTRRLYHVDLPRLSEAGLVDYDDEAGTVAYEGHPQLRVPWMHSVLGSEFRRSLTGESSTDGVGTVEGREQVVSFGQSLCDRAEDELVCMFTDTQLLEAGCLTRIRDASRRGVDVSLGIRDPEVRAYVRENAPEVTLWEPDTSWLNLPAPGDNVGRLVLADREAVMLGTLLEQTSDGLHEEQAIVGEGEQDTLVTMVRQLLQPHLEAIDGTTDDSEIRSPT